MNLMPFWKRETCWFVELEDDGEDAELTWIWRAQACKQYENIGESKGCNFISLEGIYKCRNELQQSPC